MVGKNVQSPPRYTVGNIERNQLPPEIEESEESEIVDSFKGDFKISIKDNTVLLQLNGEWVDGEAISLQNDKLLFMPRFLEVERILAHYFSLGAFIADYNEDNGLFKRVKKIDPEETRAIDYHLMHGTQEIEEVTSREIADYLNFVIWIFKTLTEASSLPEFATIRAKENFEIPAKFAKLDIYGFVSLRPLHNMSKSRALIESFMYDEFEDHYHDIWTYFRFRSFRPLIYLMYDVDPLNPALILNNEELKKYLSRFTGLPRAQFQFLLMEERKLDPYQ